MKDQPIERKIIVHEEYGALKEKTEILSEQLSEMVAKYTDMISHQYRYLMTEYMTKIGTLEPEMSQRG